MSALLSALNSPTLLQWAAAIGVGYALCDLKTRYLKAVDSNSRETDKVDSPAQSSASTQTSALSLSESMLPPELFEQAVECSASGLTICDLQQSDLPIVYASPGFEALTGYTAEEVIGKSCRFMQGEDRQQLGIDEIRKAIAQKKGCKVLLRNYHKSGRAFWNELTLSPLKDDAGAVTHYVGTQVDISHYLETFKALQESELRYQHLYEETPAMLHSIDSEGRITIVSHYWLEKLGYERHEAIGQPISTFLTPASNGKMAKVRSQMQPNEVYRNLPCRLIKKNGKHIDALLSTVAESSTDGSASSLGVLIDITERRKAQEKLRRSEALLRAINDLPPTGIFVMDCSSGKALFINSEFYQIWQLSHLQAAVLEERINGEQLLSECLSNVDLDAFVSASTAEDFTDGNRIVEDEVPLLDGRTLRRLYGPIQENNTTFAYLYTFEDITERKQAEQALAEATQSAEAANKAKSEFLANMSHELRSPLNAILGFTHILKSGHLDREQREHLEIVHRSGEHLLALINDVLDISKIEAGRLVANESEFDLPVLIEEVQQMFQETAREKGLKLSVVRSPHLPQIIYSDRLKLRQILINLLSNAVKFTAEGSVTLTAKATAAADLDSPPPDYRHDYQPFTFEVADTGPGIPPSDRAQLFDAFVQTASGLAAHQGSGLGLAISNEYARLLNGRLDVASTVVGEGTTFMLSMMALPIESAIDSTAPQRPAREITGLAPDQPSYQILIVDDVALNRKLLYQLLVNVGFDVRVATSGEEAIAQWKDWRPQLIWMDMRMPGIGGAEATRQIKALDATRQTAILALTASVFEDNRTEALSSGCDDFVCKPIAPQEIFEKMARHLDIRYLYDLAEPSDAIAPMSLSSLTAALSKVSDSWRYALTQATLDLDDAAISQLVDELPTAAHRLSRSESESLAAAIHQCVQDLSYKKLLQTLQEAEAVSP